MDLRHNRLMALLLYTYSNPRSPPVRHIHSSYMRRQLFMQQQTRVAFRLYFGSWHNSVISPPFLRGSPSNRPFPRSRLASIESSYGAGCCRLRGAGVGETGEAEEARVTCSNRIQIGRAWCGFCMVLTIVNVMTTLFEEMFCDEPV